MTDAALPEHAARRELSKAAAVSCRRLLLTLGGYAVTMGGELEQYHVVVSNERLKAHGLALSDVVSALRSANTNVGRGYVTAAQRAPRPGRSMWQAERFLC